MKKGLRIKTAGLLQVNVAEALRDIRILIQTHFRKQPTESNFFAWVVDLISTVGEVLVKKIHLAQPAVFDRVVAKKFAVYVEAESRFNETSKEFGKIKGVDVFGV